MRFLRNIVILTVSDNWGSAAISHSAIASARIIYNLLHHVEKFNISDILSRKKGAGLAYPGSLRQGFQVSRRIWWITAINMPENLLLRRWNALQAWWKSINEWNATCLGCTKCDEEARTRRQSVSGKWSILSNRNDPFDSDAIRTLGKGKSSIYVYYYPTYWRLAEYEGKELWACKISRVKPQVRTEIPEPPEIKFFFKTDDPENLEQTLHNILKFRGKHIADAGKEWFMTSPNEIEEIYKNIMENV